MKKETIDNLKILAVLSIFVIVAIGAAATLFQDSTKFSYYKVEANKDALTVGEYLEKEGSLSSLNITPEVLKKLGEVRKFIVKSDNEPTKNSGDILLSFGGSDPDSQLHILFTNTKP